MPQSKPEILVTGASGFIGSNLLQRLISDTIPIRATFHQRPPRVVQEQIEYVNCDLSATPGDCDNVVAGIRCVFHSASTPVRAGQTTLDSLRIFQKNYLLNARMLRAAHHAGVEKFLWLGSTTGYPPTGKRPVTEEEMLEGEPHDAFWFVGWMNRFTEVLCRAYGEKSGGPMEVVVLRPTNVYGPYDNYDLPTSRVIPALIRKVVERRDPIEVWGTGEDVRDAVYVDDVVDAMVLAMQTSAPYGAFNIGTGRGHSVKEILQTILDVGDYKDARVVFDASKPTSIPIRLVDTSKAARVLGFRAKTGLRDGLEKTMGWYK